MFSCVWPCAATFIVGLVAGAAGMWAYFMLGVLDQISEEAENG